MTETSGLLSSLVALTERLTALITRENTLLRQREPRQLNKFHDEKIRLTDLYTREMAALRRNDGVLDGARPEDIASLKQVTASFRKALAEHNSIVGALKSVTEGMIQAIADEVTKRNNPVQGYGTDAILQARVHGAPTSIALDQVI